MKKIKTYISMKSELPWENSEILIGDDLWFAVTDVFGKFLARLYRHLIGTVIQRLNNHAGIIELTLKIQVKVKQNIVMLSERKYFSL